MLKLPPPVIKNRIKNEDLYYKALEEGATVLQALVIANRDIPKGTDIQGFMNPSLDNIPNIGQMQDIKKAGNRIADAIIEEEQICLACDFDVDGISSAAVMYKALVDLFGYDASKVDVCISNRMKEGYGLNDQVIDRILLKDPIPSLVVTADQGSANEPQIKRYIEETTKISKKRKGSKRTIDRVGEVIVSDHHEIPTSGGPTSAYAFVNPQRHDDVFPDKTICGCTVAMFVMATVRAALIKKGHLGKDAPTIKPLMAFSTAATISDCVSMASQLNRAIVRHGLEEINNETLPAWKAMKNLCVKEAIEPVRAESIAFGLGPMINACSRTGGDGMNAVRYYLADSDNDAKRYLSFLNVDNDIRKDIEKRLVQEAMEKSVDLIEKGFHSLVIPIKQGHHGIHGIAASRVVERFGRPTIILSPKATTKEKISQSQAEMLIDERIDLKKVKEFYDIPKSYSFVSHEVKKGKNNKKEFEFFKETVTVMSGSGRSVDGLGDDHKGQLNLLGCMIEAHEKHNIFLGFGGHHMAAGMGLDADKALTLRKAIEEAVRSKVDESELYPKIWSDGELPANYVIDEAFVEELAELEPYGRMFDYPAFTIEAEVVELNICGKNNDTGRFVIRYNNIQYPSMWFKYILNPAHKFVRQGGKYKFVVQPKFNYFRGQRTVQLSIQHAEMI